MERLPEKRNLCRKTAILTMFSSLLSDVPRIGHRAKGALSGQEAGVGGRVGGPEGGSKGGGANRPCRVRLRASGRAGSTGRGRDSLSA